MYDMHSHILPNIDDGSSSLKDSIEMAIQASECGVDCIFATPHYVNGHFTLDKSSIYNAYKKLIEELSVYDINLKLKLGQEIFLTRDLQSNIEKGVYISLAGTDYYLVEFPMHETPDYAEDLLYEISLTDKKVIIAHPERYLSVIKDTESIMPFLSFDNVYLQVNAGSISGVFGNDIKKTAFELLNRKMIHFIGSDAHNIRSRNTGTMGEALSLLHGSFDSDYIENIFKNNPECMLQNHYIEKVKPLSKQIKKSFWAFWK